MRLLEPSNARRWFLLDAAGVAVSVGLLLVGVRRFPELFGVAPGATLVLAAVAALLGGYDVACLVLTPRPVGRYLRALAAANLAYPLVAGAVLAADGVPLTGLGGAYFLGEALVLVALARAEASAGAEALRSEVRSRS